MKPIIIYVSGAPGAGKTTLAKLLSERLYIPHVSSDLVHGGMEFTQIGHDRKSAISEVFVPLLIGMAEKGVSIVVDHVLQKHIAKTTIIGKLSQHANVIYVHVQTKDPISRYTQRIQESTVPDVVRRRSGLLELATYHTDNLVNTALPIALGLPTIVVDTDDGYKPGLDDIIDFIVKHKDAN